MSSNEEKELKALKEETKKTLDKLVLDKFPKKILELDKLITDKFDPKNMMKIKSTVNIPIPDKPKDGQPSTGSTQDKTGVDKRIFLFPNGVNETNDQMLKLSEEVRPLVLDFVADMRALKFAIKLMVPKVEDGNNFGVEIQSEVIYSITNSEQTATVRLSQFKAHFQSRGNIVTWIARWPHCDDYRRCLQESDQKFFLILCLIVRELRDDYICLNDLIVKNLEKIKNPRPARDISIY